MASELNVTHTNLLLEQKLLVAGTYTPYFSGNLHNLDIIL